MPAVAFATLGCKVNQCETDSLMKIFTDVGYNIVPFNEISDVYIINTCTVTKTADAKSRQMIRKARKKSLDALIVVVGCYADNAAENMQDDENILFAGMEKDSRLLARIDSLLKKDENVIVNSEYDSALLPFNPKSHKTRAFLKIQDGCQQYCSYCIIPYVRNKLASMSPDDILYNLHEIDKAGFREIVLTGIHLGLYGKDLHDTSLVNVIKLIEAYNGNISRFRLGSLEPSDISDELIEVLADSRKFCHHLHVPLQAASDRLLSLMHRPYSLSEYTEILKKLRTAIPDIAISTDLIVGFPGETEFDFNSGLEVVSSMEFSRLHVFKYSIRSGTKAANMNGHLSNSIKDTRSNILIQLGNKMAQAYETKFLSTIQNVLVETIDKDRSMLCGLTPQYLQVVFPGEESLIGNIVPVYLTKLNCDYIVGKIKK